MLLAIPFKSVIHTLATPFKSIIHALVRNSYLATPFKSVIHALVAPFKSSIESSSGAFPSIRWILLEIACSSLHIESSHVGSHRF